MENEEKRVGRERVKAPAVGVGAVALGIAGILFVLYPAIRPFSDEASLQGAAAFASVEWIVAHVLAILGFTLLPVGFLGLYIALQATGVERLTYWGLVLSLIGVGLTLPFYGAEVFALHTIGQTAVSQNSIDVLHLADAIRFGPGFYMILAGLLLLLVGTILVAVAIWRSARLPKWSGIPLALGFVLYIPQYTATQPVRVAHGWLITLGCLWVGIAMWRKRGKA